MNLFSGNTISASQRDILGIPVCDLGWADAFAFAEQVACMPFGQTVIAFLNARWRVDDEKESGCCEVQHPLSYKPYQPALLTSQASSPRSSACCGMPA